jgi:tRNA 2-thiocytidine biosynthesis protein TtcA
MTGLEKRLIELISNAKQTWDLFQEDEKLIVGVSGGKDSLALLYLLEKLTTNLHPVHIRLDSSHDISFITRNNLKVEVLESDVYAQSHKPESKKHPCFVCSRKRRKMLIEYAEANGIRKIVLGHHRDDVCQTLLMNMMYSREISTLQPKQELFAGKFEIIRPLYLIPEEFLLKLSKEQDWVIAKPACAEADSSKRVYVKRFIDKLQKDHPKIDVYDNIFASLKQVKPDFLPFEPLSSKI